ncbi:MAG TPA: hypothetical protein VF875_12405 [Anaeromyxobacter sp.]
MTAPRVRDASERVLPRVIERLCAPAADVPSPSLVSLQSRPGRQAEAREQRFELGAGI